MLNNRLLKMFVFCLFIISPIIPPIFAQDNQEPNPQEEIILNDEIINEITLVDEDIPNNKTLSNDRSGMRRIEQQARSNSSLSYDIYSEHYVAEIDPLGRFVILENGTIWDIHPDHRFEVLTWHPCYERIVITPHRDKASTWKFLLWNVDTGWPVKSQVWWSVESEDYHYHDLSNPYGVGNYNVRYITFINASKGYLELSDGSQWQIRKSDWSKLKVSPRTENGWYLEDRVCVGTNEAYFSGLFHKFILINYTNDEYTYVLAKLLN